MENVVSVFVLLPLRPLTLLIMTRWLVSSLLI